MFEIRGTQSGKLFGRTETYPAACAMADMCARKYGEPTRIAKR